MSHARVAKNSASVCGPQCPKPVGPQCPTPVGPRTWCRRPTALIHSTRDRWSASTTPAATASPTCIWELLLPLLPAAAATVASVGDGACGGGFWCGLKEREGTTSPRGGVVEWGCQVHSAGVDM